MPARSASVFPLISRPTPAPRVTAHAPAKSPATCEVERLGERMRLVGCGSRRWRRPGCDALHRDLPARALAHVVDHVDADRPDDDDPDRCRADDAADRRRRRRSAPISTPETTSVTSSPSSTGLSAPTRKVKRPLAPDRDVADHEHHRLHRDPADQVARGEPEVPLRGRRDRDRELRQAAGDREQQQPAELLAEPEPRIERVGRLRERDPGDPRRGRGEHEDQDEERRREAGHEPQLSNGGRLAAPEDTRSTV